MPAAMNIVLQRNEDYDQDWTLVNSDNTPFDLTGCSIAMQVRQPLDNSVLIESATISITNAVTGEFNVILRASEGSALGNYGDPLQEYLLPYDARVTYPDGLHLALVSGNILLQRGKTFA